MNVYEKLSSINVNKLTEKKNKLTYLSWAHAWGEVKKVYPEATYEILKFENNLPYVYDEKTGYMVFTTVTIEGLTHEMWLFVMDGANKSMKCDRYSYKVKDVEWVNRRPVQKKDNEGNLLFIDKFVDGATMFDINKTIMRCLTKNLGMFGLGLYIYAGEDLPDETNEKAKGGKEANERIKKANEDIQESLYNDLTKAKINIKEFTKVFNVTEKRVLAIAEVKNSLIAGWNLIKTSGINDIATFVKETNIQLSKISYNDLGNKCKEYLSIKE